MLKVNPTQTLQALLSQEDTNGDKRITIDGDGKKTFDIIQTNGTKHQVKGTYFLSNLLQELVLEIKKGNTKTASISLDRIYEKPTQRISRLIKEIYWDSLTRIMDKNGLKKVMHDEKVQQDFFYLYVPNQDKKAIEYYTALSRELPKLKVNVLPKKITPEYVLSINNKPGLLALALNKDLQGFPFVVPGGRFNEMYGWDSYFIYMGLVIDKKTELAKGIIENFEYQINNYGKILNANRSYYLSRTQPPFFSSMIKEYIETHNFDSNWLTEKLSTAIHEYETVWMMEGKRLTKNNLNRYAAEGIGYVFEVEDGHFDSIMQFHARKHNILLPEFEEKYKNRQIEDSELDKYFFHDRSLRESGHDTTNRLVNKCGHLNTVDLNALLYKYETDFFEIIKKYFKGNFVSNKNRTYTSEYWLKKAEERKKLVNNLLWNKNKGMYFDYNFNLKEQTNFVSATTFYPLWSKLCNPHQAELLVKNVLPKLKCKGGIVSSTKGSRGIVSEENPQRQWDYPFGWAPHQMLIWKGLIQYNYSNEAQELIYRWLWLITKIAVDYNGTIAEKYDVVNCTHKIETEYGNVGVDFEYIPDGGFGWMNASYQYGLSLLKKEYINKLNDLIDPDILFGLGYFHKY